MSDSMPSREASSNTAVSTSADAVFTLTLVCGGSAVTNGRIAARAGYETLRTTASSDARTTGAFAVSIAIGWLTYQASSAPPSRTAPSGSSQSAIAATAALG